MMNIKHIVEQLKSARLLLVYFSLVCLLFLACTYKGYRLLDIFGTEQWEQDGPPGTGGIYHK